MTFNLRALSVIISFGPPVGVAVYMAWLGLNVPFWDQWDVVPLLIGLNEGTLSLADLLSQHNEHRPFFPRLLWLGLAELTGYNTNAELWLNWGLALLTFGVFGAYTVWVFRQRGANLPGGLFPVLALLVFNLAQWESWLFGVQTIMFLGMLAIVAGFVVLARFDNWRGVLGGAVLGGVATFCMANAVLYWPIGGVMVVLVAPPGQRWRHTALWGVAAGLSLAVFFVGWSPTNSATLPIVWEDPVRYFNWVLNFLGAPLLTYWYAWLFGLGSVVGLVWVGPEAVRRQPVAWLAPYWALIVFTLLSAAAIGVGRAGVSLTSAVASRYLTMTVWYWASLLVLLALTGGSQRWQKWWLAGLALMLCVGMVGGGVLGYHWRYLGTWPTYQAIHNHQPVSDAELVAISGKDPAVVRDRLTALCHYGWSACGR